jgi:hypothetical protein
MGLYDTVKCEYPLPDPAHQSLEFQTKDLDCLLEAYTITRAGRLFTPEKLELIDGGIPGAEDLVLLLLTQLGLRATAQLIGVAAWRAAARE